MSALDDLKTYLGALDASQWSTAELEGVIASETAAQARVIRTVTPAGVLVGAESLFYIASHYADLYEALMRRCARNLAMRKLPIGLAMGDAETTRVGSRDPEIRRLESPYRKLIVA